MPKNTYFPDRGCVRPLRHLYGYATATGCNHVYNERIYRVCGGFVVCGREMLVGGRGRFAGVDAA